jgi:hypothetical protein
MDQEHKEELRKEVLQCLAVRHPLAFTCGQVAERVRRRRLLDCPVTEEDALQALSLLEELELVSHEVDPLGSTRYYKATGKGVLESERMGL